MYTINQEATEGAGYNVTFVMEPEDALNLTRLFYYRLGRGINVKQKVDKKNFYPSGRYINLQF